MPCPRGTSPTNSSLPSHHAAPAARTRQLVLPVFSMGRHLPLLTSFGHDTCIPQPPTTNPPKAGGEPLEPAAAVLAGASPNGARSSERGQPPPAEPTMPRPVRNEELGGQTPRGHPRRGEPRPPANPIPVQHRGVPDEGSGPRSPSYDDKWGSPDMWGFRDRRKRPIGADGFERWS